MDDYRALVWVLGFATISKLTTAHVNSRVTPAKIWRLEADEGFVANMSLLNIGATTLRASQFAQAYWAGESGPVLAGMRPLC